MAGHSPKTTIHEAGRPRMALGSLLMAIAVMTAAASIPKIVHAERASAASWKLPKSVPKAKTNSGPALVAFNGRLYAFWTGVTAPYGLWYSAFNGTKWTTQSKVPSALTGLGDAPGIGVYDGNLYVTWTGEPPGPYHVWYSAFNGTTWTAQATVPSALTRYYTSPALAAYNGDLYFAWVGASSAEDVWYSAFNGTTWTPQATVPGSASVAYNDLGGPALAAYQGELFAAWDAPPSCVTFSTYCMAVSSFNGSAWIYSTVIPGPDPSYDGSSIPALAVYNNRLYDAWYDDYNGGGEIIYMSFNGASWSSFQHVPNTLSGTCNQPGLAAYSTHLVTAWMNSSQTTCAATGTISYSLGP